MECARRRDQESIRAGPQPIGLKLGIGRCRRGEPLRGSGWHRNRRFDRQPVVDQRHRRYQADRRIGKSRRNHSDFSYAGHCGADGSTIADAAALLTVLAGEDPDDEATAASFGRVPADYTRFLDAKGLRGARIGVARNYFGFHDGVDTVMKVALDAIQRAGAMLVDPADLPNMDKIGDAELIVLLYELKANLNAYLARRRPEERVRSLKDVIDFNERNARAEMPYFGQDLFLKAEAKGPLMSSEYLDALATCRRLARNEGIDAVMDREKLDALIAPTDGPAWLTDLALGDHQIGSSSAAAAVAGYPSITVPAGFVHDLPVGISFFGRPWSEATLIGYAYAFEQATRARKPPRFAPSAPLP